MMQLAKMQDMNGVLDLYKAHANGIMQVVKVRMCK